MLVIVKKQFIDPLSVPLNGILIGKWLQPGISLVAQAVENLPETRETQVRYLGQEDPLKKGMATHSSILTWRISWTEESKGLQSMGFRESGQDWAPNRHTHNHGWVLLIKLQFSNQNLKGQHFQLYFPFGVEHTRVPSAAAWRTCWKSSLLYIPPLAPESQTHDLKWWCLKVTFSNGIQILLCLICVHSEQT